MGITARRHRQTRSMRWKEGMKKRKWKLSIIRYLNLWSCTTFPFIDATLSLSLSAILNIFNNRRGDKGTTDSKRDPYKKQEKPTWTFGLEDCILLMRIMLRRERRVASRMKSRCDKEERNRVLDTWMQVREEKNPNLNHLYTSSYLVLPTNTPKCLSFFHTLILSSTFPLTGEIHSLQLWEARGLSVSHVMFGWLQRSQKHQMARDEGAHSLRSTLPEVFFYFDKKNLFPLTLSIERDEKLDHRSFSRLEDFKTSRRDKREWKASKGEENECLHLPLRFPSFCPNPVDSF